MILRSSLFPFKIDIKSFTIPFFFNILLTAVIYSQAELGRLLGDRDQPLAISLIWPATGFSLAALLLFGLKSWPGVFMGNFCYNFLHLYLYTETFLASFLTAFGVSSGSLLQALLGNYLMRHFSSTGYFITVKDIVIFLIPSGILTCLVASTIGIASLYLFRPTPLITVANSWLTFWIGDLLGVYVFTPLLVVWAILKPISRPKQFPWETLAMGVSFITIVYLTYSFHTFFYHFYIPLALWCAYRFGMHGGTLGIFMIALAIIIPTSLGMGIFSIFLVDYPLFFLTLFIEVVVASTLFFAAIVNERDLYHNQVDALNLDLQHAMEKYQIELKERDYKVWLRSLISETAKWMRIPLGSIHAMIQGCLNSSGELRKEFHHLKEKLPPNTTAHLQSRFENLESLLVQLDKKETEATQLAQIIEEQIKLAVPDKIKVQSVDIKILLRQSLNQVMSETEKQHPDFTFNLFEEFEESISMALTAPEELRHAIYLLLMRAIDSMREKKERLQASYSPILKLRVKMVQDQIEVMIRDNGLGIQDGESDHFFISFFSSPSEELAERLLHNASLSLAHDLIVHVYKGAIRTSSKPEEYLQLDIRLPTTY